MSLRCLIIDDKPLAIDILTDYVSKISFLELAGSTTNPIVGLNMIRDNQIDLVFLDIQMPELTGLQFMTIVGKDCKFVLTTAYPEHALDGYDYDVVDYLLKPISFDRFYRAAEKAFRVTQVTMPQLQQQLPLITGTFKEFLFVKTEHRIQRITLHELLYVEGLQNYVSLHTTHERVMSLQTLKGIEEQLPEAYFIRVHRSYIVNLRHISSVERSRIYIGETIIPIGDTYREAFHKILRSE